MYIHPQKNASHSPLGGARILGRQRQLDLCEFEVSQPGHKAGPGQQRLLHRETLSGKTREKGCFTHIGIDVIWRDISSVCFFKADEMYGNKNTLNFMSWL